MDLEENGGSAFPDLKQVSRCVSALTEDDLFWYLGIGRWGQCAFECDILPLLVREFYAQKSPEERSAVSVPKEKDV